MKPPVEMTPLPTESDEHGKALRRRHKQEEKLLRDAVRPPDSWERFRILTEVVEEERNVVEIADHKARYAVLIVGVLNAVIFVLIGRGGVFARLPDWLEPWLIGLIALYAALTFLFVYHAIDCLRPRQLGGKAPVHVFGVPGLLFWEGIEQHDPETYQREWSEARMDQLSREAALIAHRLAHLINAKYRALTRLYHGLRVMVFLCSVLLLAYAIWGRVP